jgi:hypothetical protein
MATFTENRMNLIGNDQITRLAKEINRRFLIDMKNQNADRNTAVGRILYGLVGIKADLTDTAIQGGRSIAYLDETNWRSPNALSFVVVNSDACKVQDHIARCAATIDPNVVVANLIRDEYLREATFRYVHFNDGQLREYVSKVALPQGNYYSDAGQKRLIKFEKQSQKNAFNLLKNDFSEISIDALEWK